MSILKMVNETGTNRKRLEDKIDYLTADSKTDRGKLVGSSNCISKFVAEEMMAVKKLTHKTGGRMWIEIVVSATPDDQNRPDAAYMQLAKDFVGLFAEYQTLYALHLDSKIRHLHFMINTVSVRTGKKFSQSPSGLQRLKANTNDILMKHGFEIIKIGAEQMLDLTDHSADIGFDYLEVEEPVMTEESVTIGHDIDITKPGIILPKAPTWAQIYPLRGWNTMRYEATPAAPEIPTQAQESTTVALPAAPEMPVPAQEPTAVTLPAERLSARPTISVDMGPHDRIHETGPVLREETLEAVRELSATSTEQLNAGANMAVALFGAAQTRGFDVDIAVNVAPTIDIDFGQSIMPEHPDIVIGADVTVDNENN